MCTLSWLSRDDGYELFFNRDESRARRRALAPEEGVLQGVRFIAPRDGDFGGSWIVANELGVTSCMLNLYWGPPPSGPLADDYVSRGLLALELADAPTPRAVEDRIARSQTARYRPFSSVAFAPGCSPRLVQWDGERLVTLSLTDAQRPFISSGYDVEGVRHARQAEFRRLADAAAGDLAPEDVERYHRSHAPAQGPYSACMHRDDAATVSLTRVQVGPEAIRLWYAGGPPCETPFGEPLTLPRREP